MTNKTIIQDYTINCDYGLNNLILPTRLVVYPNYKIFFQSNSSLITASNVPIFDSGITANNTIHLLPKFNIEAIVYKYNQSINRNISINKIYTKEGTYNASALIQSSNLKITKKIIITLSYFVFF